MTAQTEMKEMPLPFLYVFLLTFVHPLAQAVGCGSLVQVINKPPYQKPCGKAF